MAAWKNTKLLVWGTTYPEFSKSYYETVCTGAVDEATGRLVRIYPITLRHLKEPFRQYDWIEVEIQGNPKDRRPESFRIRQDGIKVVGHLDPKDGWAERSEWVLREGNVFPSVEALWRSHAEAGTSLGLVKPKAVNRVFVKQLPVSARREWEAKREEAIQQKDLYVDVDARTKDLVFMPVRYMVDFTCDDRDCNGHKMSVLDWGTYVLSRKQFRKKGRLGAENGVIAKIEENLDEAKKDAYLFLGNTLAHPTNFMIVGFYYPKRVAKKAKASPPPSRQGELF